MILFISQNTQLQDKVAKELTKRKWPFKCVPNSGDMSFEHVYDSKIHTLIADYPFGKFPAHLEEDLINGLARRIRVILVRDETKLANRSVASISRRFSELVTFVTADAVEILKTLGTYQESLKKNKNLEKQEIPTHQPADAVKILTDHGSLGILSIDATSFRKVEVDYGLESFHLTKEFFKEVLLTLRGKTGCFRQRDILVRRSENDNLYLIFLEPSRFRGGLPLPGTLERIADRVANAIQNALWHEIALPANQRRLPDCIQSLPVVAVGYASTIFNPCLDALELLSSAIEDSYTTAQMQKSRFKRRQKEVLQMLIQSDVLLRPQYQGVFKLKDLDFNKLEQDAKNKDSSQIFIHSISALFGFESLIRVEKDAAKQLLGDHSVVDPELLYPSLLFSMALECNVALELDQSCVKKALLNAKELPGCLMVNILPRSLYSMNFLNEILGSRKSVMLEISESEAINNLTLITKVKDKILSENVLIAADDFGKANAGLEHVVKLRPHVIKLDKGLVEDIDKDNVRREHVKGLVAVAKLLGASVLAEGIETFEELKCVHSLGIDLAQGYFLHRPSRSEVILDLMASAKKLPRIKRAA